jgi:hypothetical protein
MPYVIVEQMNNEKVLDGNYSIFEYSVVGDYTKFTATNTSESIELSLKTAQVKYIKVTDAIPS